MKSRDGVTSGQRERAQRRRTEGPRIVKREEKSRQEHATEGGKPNRAGAVQGQNGELGNSVNPRHRRPLGKLEH